MGENTEQRARVELKSLKRGTFIMVGIPNDDAKISPMLVVAKCNASALIVLFKSLGLWYGLRDELQDSLRDVRKLIYI
ncbi:hypothetical protein L917_19103 [Phytophthora nicotianae]|uniref:Uncharacterized protein n=1 Tax=Phytophthora nicotianae TaxID=4792 RepID=W2K5K9_PHYNI|nr:hypothetical protein L917_19103 [Phytophthora nicotianae]